MRAFWKRSPHEEEKPDSSKPAAEKAQADSGNKGGQSADDSWTPERVVKLDETIARIDAGHNRRLRSKGLPPDPTLAEVLAQKRREWEQKEGK